MQHSLYMAAAAGVREEFCTQIVPIFGAVPWGTLRVHEVLAQAGQNDETRCNYASYNREKWLRGLDLNQRPSGYEPDELPGCSTPRSN